MMAVTVRFPNGQAVRYNSANYVWWNADGSATLGTKKENGQLVARLLTGSGAIVEFYNPCEVSNPLTDRESAVRLVLRAIREIRDTAALRDLKRALQDFNAKTHTWKKGE